MDDQKTIRIHLEKIYEICYGKVLYDRHKDILYAHENLKFENCTIYLSQQYEDKVIKALKSGKIAFFQYFLLLVVVLEQLNKQLSSDETPKENYRSEDQHYEIIIKKAKKPLGGRLECALDDFKKTRISKYTQIKNQIKRFLYDFSFKYFLIQIIIFILIASLVLNWDHIILLSFTVDIYKTLAIIFLFPPFLKLNSIFVDTISKIQLYYKQDYLFSRYKKYNLEENPHLFNDITFEPVFSEFDDDLLVGIFVEEFHARFISKAFSIKRASVIIVDMLQGQGKSSFINLFKNRVNFNIQLKFDFWRYFLHSLINNKINIIDLDMTYISKVSESKKESFFQLLHDTVLTNLDSKQQQYIKQLTNSATIDLGYIKFNLPFTSTNTEKLKKELSQLGQKHVIIINDYERLPEPHREEVISLLYALSNVPMLTIILPTSYQQFSESIFKLERNKKILASQHDLVAKLVYGKFNYSTEYARLLATFISNVFDTKLGISRIKIDNRNGPNKSLKDTIGSIMRQEILSNNISIREVQYIIPKIDFAWRNYDPVRQFYYHFIDYRNQGKDTLEWSEVEEKLSKNNEYKYFVLDLFCIPEPEIRKLIKSDNEIVKNFWTLFVTNSQMIDLIIKIRGGNGDSLEIMPNSMPIEFNISYEYENSYKNFFKSLLGLTNTIESNILLPNIIKYNVLWISKSLLQNEITDTDGISNNTLKQQLDSDNTPIQNEIKELNNKLELQKQHINKLIKSNEK